ncbi:MAG: hypothetical protein ACXVBW_07315, partial [Bdellovibrionota bacterium]
MQPSLSPLKDDALTAATASWVHQESVATLQVLHHLREIERRRLYAKLGYGSLYEFAIKKLKYSEGSAYRRITAMRLIKEVPEAESAIQEGKLTLSTASTLQQFLYQEQKSKAPYSAEQKREILKTVQGLSKRETERVLTSLSPGAIPRERVRPLSETETQITFVADRELMSRIERLRELLA